MTEAHLTGAAENLPEGIDEYEAFKSREDLERFLEKHGISAETPKSILYAFKSSLGNLQWDEEVLRYFSKPCPVGEILERIADINAIMADDPCDFTVGLVIESHDGGQIAIRYQMEECELVSSFEELEYLDREKDFEYIYEFEAVVCRDYRQLPWEGSSLIDAQV